MKSIRNSYIGVFPNSDLMSLGLESVTSPLGQLIIASRLKQITSTSVFNLDITPVSNFWEYFDSINDNITVGLTVTSGNIKNAFNLTKELKSRGAKVIIGGPEVSMAGAKIFEHHDYIDGIVIGAGEKVIEDILFERSNPYYITNNNHRLINYTIKDYPKLSFTDIEIDYNLLYDLDKLNGASYLWGNDCSLAYNRCYFCGRLALGRGYRPPEKIWNELNQLYQKGIKFYYNTTDSITTNKKAFRDFVLSKPLNMIDDKHRVFVNANQVDDFVIESLKLLNGVAVIGFESFGNFENTQKLGASVKNNLDVIEKLARKRLPFVLSFVLGLPHEDYNSLQMTSDGIINLVKTYGDLIEAIHISPLLITTGSKAYNDLFSVQHINNKYKYKSYPYDPIEMSNDYFNLFCKISRKDALMVASKTIREVNSLYPSIKIGLKGVLPAELDFVNSLNSEFSLTTVG